MLAVSSWTYFVVWSSTPCSLMYSSFLVFACSTSPVGRLDHMLQCILQPAADFAFVRHPPSVCIVTLGLCRIVMLTLVLSSSKVSSPCTTILLHISSAPLLNLLGLPSIGSPAFSAASYPLVLIASIRLVILHRMGRVPSSSCAA